MNAAKRRLTFDDVKEILEGVEEIISSKGVRVERFLMKDKPSAATLEGALIGPTGRLRAPTARIGSRLLVGFDEATYRTTLG